MSGANRPLIIIGAPRSGTNMLRDAVTSLPGLGTWPCDEINYIWRHGNVRHPSDAFTREMARPDVRDFIRRQFDEIARRFGIDTVVEKTCANSLRVGFVDEVVPDARFLFVVRDGVDAVASAALRWKTKLDIPYLLRKARYIPVSDLPYHVLRNVGNRWHQLWSREKRLAFWGPSFDGLSDVLARHNLAEVCALQWQACVSSAAAELDAIDPRRVLRVKYEEFVHHPVQHLERITRFLELDVPAEELAQAASRISDRSIGKGRSSLDPELLCGILPLIREDLERYGYTA